MTSPEKKTILLVDDTPANIQVANSILKDDYKIRIATSGPKALELTKVQPRPDLILLDIMMPNLDGHGVCEALRGDLSTREIPVIVLSGLADVSEKVKSLGLGADDYLTKPFDPDELLARIQAALRRAQ